MSWIQTLSGKAFDYGNPDPESITIFDIAHALSNICRFTGHTISFYSVAQHSVLCSYAPEVQGDPTLQLYALLHDAHEAYVGDVNSPLKSLCQGYQEIEDRVQRTCFEKFHLEWPQPPVIKTVDLRMLSTERLRMLVTMTERCWPQALNDYSPYTVEELPAELCKAMLPGEARQVYLERFIALWGQCRAPIEGVTNGLPFKNPL